VIPGGLSVLVGLIALTCALPWWAGALLVAIIAGIIARS
jgi:hypothetical protein